MRIFRFRSQQGWMPWPADLALPRDVIVAEAITTWLDSEERRRIATLRTLAAANTIVVVEHDRVIDWADSL